MGDLTVLLPTKNRTGFLERTLRYYRGKEVPWEILIGDSSDGTDTQKLSEEFAGDLKLQYFRYDKDISITSKWITMFQHVASDFVLTVADDDIIVVEAVAEALDFLKKSSDHAAAGGQNLYFRLSGDEEYGEVVEIFGDELDSKTFAEAKDRLHQQLGRYQATWYLIHRKDVIEATVEAFEAAGAYLDYWLTELMESSISAMFGKIKVFPIPYAFRQIHEARTAVAETSNPQTILDWLLADGAKEKMEFFVDQMGGLLCERSELSLDDARAWVRHFFWCYLADTFQSCASQPGDMKRISKRAAMENGHFGSGGLEGIFRRWRKRRSRACGAKAGYMGKSIDLIGFLDDSHRYASTFKELREAVETDQKEGFS